MMGCKIVFKDEGSTKTIRGSSFIFDGNLVKITDFQGKTIFVNREAIVFIREE